MKPLPTDPFEFQRRAMTAMCDDLFDMGAGKAKSFKRLDALREVSIQSHAADQLRNEGEQS